MFELVWLSDDLAPVVSTVIHLLRRVGASSVVSHHTHTKLSHVAVITIQKEEEAKTQKKQYY
jgi:hypothetical protein